jgi:hypothetical protein
MEDTMADTDQPSCGRGLAEHSALPGTFADVLAAIAENLEIHRKALDPSDEAAIPERHAYTRLTGQLRTAASELRTIAAEMSGYRDLPMGRHDPAALSSEPIVQALETLVKREQELMALLETWLQRYRTMLGQVHEHGAR